MEIDRENGGHRRYMGRRESTGRHDTDMGEEVKGYETGVAEGRKMARYEGHIQGRREGRYGGLWGKMLQQSTLPN